MRGQRVDAAKNKAKGIRLLWAAATLCVALPIAALAQPCLVDPIARVPQQDAFDRGFSPDGRLLLIGSGDDETTLYDAATVQPLRTLVGRYTHQWTELGPYFRFGGGDGHVLVDLVGDDSPAAAIASGGNLIVVSFSRDGHFAQITRGGADMAPFYEGVYTLHFVSFPDLAPLAAFEKPRHYWGSFASEAPRAAVFQWGGDEARTISIVDLASGGIVGTVELPAPVQGVPRLAPDGRHLLAADGGGEGGVWSLDSGERLSRFPAQSPSTSPNLPAGGDGWIATVDFSDTAITMIDFRRPEVVETIPDSASAHLAAFKGDRMLLWTKERVWVRDHAEGRTVATFERPSELPIVSAEGDVALLATYRTGAVPGSGPLDTVTLVDVRSARELCHGRIPAERRLTLPAVSATRILVHDEESGLAEIYSVAGARDHR